MRVRRGPDGDIVEIGLHVPAIALVFELEDKPYVVGGKNIPAIMEWLASAHPEWAELLFEATELLGASDDADEST